MREAVQLRRWRRATSLVLDVLACELHRERVTRYNLVRS
jgi:hypothetical protein